MSPPLREPLRCYRLRSSRWSPIVAAFVSALALVACGAFVAAGGGARLLSHPGQTWPLALAVVGACMAAAASVIGVRHDRIAGGSGQVRLFESRVEVPAAFGPALTFPLPETEVRVRRVEGRLLGAAISRVAILHLRGGGAERKLSSRLFESQERLEELALDLAALARGAPLPSHEADAPIPVRPRDRFDDQLDAELDELS